MDAFISWTTADKDVKNLLVEKLQAAGLSCWDSEKECVSNFSKECILALRQCGLFVVIVSDASMKEESHVINEVIEARNLEKVGKINILVYKITDAPYSEDFTFQLNHISFVSGNVIQRRESLGGESSLDAVVQRAIKLVNARKAGKPEKPLDALVPKVSGLSINSTGYFVENSRDQILTAIGEAFTKSNVVILREFFGFGKRSTIRKFVELHRNTVKEAVLVANTRGDLRAFLQTELNFQNVHPARFAELEGDALIQEKLEVLSKLDESHLLVVQDVDFDADPDAALCQQLRGLKCRIILLTQDSADGYNDWFPVIRVGRMENQHLTQLFFHHYKRAFPEDQAMLAEPLNQFFDRIGGHTKTVELTASVLNRDMGALPEEVADYLSMSTGEGVQLKDRILDQIANVFNMEQLTRQESTALLVAACLAVPNISEKSYRQVLKACGVTDYQSITLELDRRRWLDMDLQNQSITMEPLVAQVVLNKFPEEYQVLSTCLAHIQDKASHTIFAATDTAYIRAMGKAEHFFRLTGLPVLAQSMATQRHYVVNENLSDPQPALDAMAQFDQAYPAGEYVGVDETQLTGKDLFIFNAQGFVRAAVVPYFRLMAKGSRQLLGQFGSCTLRKNTQQNTQVFNIEEIFGMPRAELESWLEELKAQISAGDELDEDDWEYVFVMECVRILEALFSANTQSVQLGFQTLLVNLLEHPQILDSPLTAQLLFAAVNPLCSAYVQSGNPMAAVMLCQQVLELCEEVSVPPRFYSIYIAALRGSNLYNDDLYDLYETLLSIYDTQGGAYFEDRQDLRNEKCACRLQYAYDLTDGGHLDEALQIFDEAWQSRQQDEDAAGDPLLELTAQVAQYIADGMIKSGDFAGAADFSREYFPLPVQARFIALGGNATREHIAFLARLQQEAAEETQEDQAAYLDYYHQFPRDNGTTLDRKYYAVADQALTYDFTRLSNEEIALYAGELRKKAARTQPLALAPEAFALASEAGFRVLGYRHHYVQYLAAAAMADGKIAEVLNGEGKTYAIVLVAFLQALYGSRVFVLDESIFLTQRNHTWMQGVYQLLGLTTDMPGETANLVKLHGDVNYVTMRDLVFAYLRAELEGHSRTDLQMDCVIIDEADMILVDEAQKECTLVGVEKNPETLNMCQILWKLIPRLANKNNYHTLRSGAVVLQPDIYPLLEESFGISWTDLGRVRLIRKAEQLMRTAIMAAFYYQQGRDYFIHNGVPVFEYKERGTFYRPQDELGYFLCQKHKLDPKPFYHNLVHASHLHNVITVRDLFRKCRLVCGTTATAVSFRKEFKDIYGLDYVAIPPHKPSQRVDYEPVVFMNDTQKNQTVVKVVQQAQQAGQPVLVCTQSVEESEIYDALLTQAGIPHSLLNAKNADESPAIIAQAGLPGAVLVANALTSRGTDIKLGGNPELMTRRELAQMGADTSGLDQMLYTLPTPQIKESQLYRQYHSIYEKNRQLCDENREAVIAAGGLCVVLTSFSKEARNEQQTRGRAGRQGEPGESYAVYSLDDASLVQDAHPGMIQWLQNNFEATGAMNEAVLWKTIRRLQRLYHDRAFSKIRNLNRYALLVDRARPALIGMRYDLSEGKVTAEDIVKDWATHKSIQKQLQQWQQGTPCTSKALQAVCDSFPQLKTVRGLRAPRVLNSLLQELLSKLQQTQVPPEFFLQPAIIQMWQEYINLHQQLRSEGSLSESELAKQMEEALQRLRLTPAEKLIPRLLNLKH